MAHAWRAIDVEQLVINSNSCFCVKDKIRNSSVWLMLNSAAILDVIVKPEKLKHLYSLRIECSVISVSKKKCSDVLKEVIIGFKLAAL